MYVSGGCSFVVVMTGVIAWQVFMNKMEAEEEKNDKAGKGMAPPTHPEPLKTWCMHACASVDGGTSWVDEPAAKARSFLSSMWQVNDAHTAEERLRWAQTQEPNAWHLVGALRIALAAYSAQYFDAARAWGWAKPIVHALQQRYPGFEAIGMEYLAARRAWKQFPPDGSGDDAEQQGYVQRFRAHVAQGFRVDYRSV
jgi:hypothetical protein